MPFSKIAHEAAMAKVAAAETSELPDAVRFGFNLACHDMGLPEAKAIRLGKFAAVALAVSAPKDGLAKIAADFSPADTQPKDPGEIMFRLQLEAQQKGIPLAQFAKQQGVNLAALQKQIQVADAGKTPAAKSMDATTKATTAKTTVPGGADFGTQDLSGQPAEADFMKQLSAAQAPSAPPAPKPVPAPVAPAPKPAVPAAPVKPAVPAAPPTSAAPKPAAPSGPKPV